MAEINGKWVSEDIVRVYAVMKSLEPLRLKHDNDAFGEGMLVFEAILYAAFPELFALKEHGSKKAKPATTVEQPPMLGEEK